MGRSERAKEAMTAERKAALAEARRRARAGVPGRNAAGRAERELKSQLARKQALSDAMWWAATSGEDKKAPTPLHELMRRTMKDDPHRFTASLLRSLPADPKQAKEAVSQEVVASGERDRRFLENVERALDDAQ
jgi:hypothetical protein